MNLAELATNLPSATKPLSAIVNKSENTKLIAIGLNQDVRLSEHKAPGKTKLIVIQGQIRYLAEGKNITLDTYETYDIPLEETHAVETDEPSIFMLSIT